MRRPGRSRRSRRLGRSLDGYRAWLIGSGYSPSVVVRFLITPGHLETGLERNALAVDQHTAEAVNTSGGGWGQSRAVAGRERLAVGPVTAPECSRGAGRSGDGRTAARAVPRGRRRPRCGLGGEVPGRFGRLHASLPLKEESGYPLSFLDDALELGEPVIAGGQHIARRGLEGGRGHRSIPVIDDVSSGGHLL
jgi:hypothetical protein